MATNIKTIIPGISENIPLKMHTTYKIGGKARYFYIVKTKEELLKCVKAADELRLPYYILGGGSNVLVSDKGFKGLIIKMHNSEIGFKQAEAVVGAGVSFSKLVIECQKRGLSGLEWAAGIPGTVGGAIYGNARVFLSEMKDSIKEVEALDLKLYTIGKISKKNCQFGYKQSIFKKKKNLIVFSAVIILKKENVKNIQKEIKKHLEFRRNAQPLNLPSAGSVFVNPKQKITNVSLINKYPELKIFNKQGYLPAGYLIHKCGLREKRVGDAQISAKHANFIVNLGNAKAKDVKKLISIAKIKVYNKFKVRLEEEIQFLN